MSNSPGKLAPHLLTHASLSLKFVLNAVLHSVALAIFLWLRYAEIVNVKLGNGQNRKGQVLEIAGRKAVVQVRYRDFFVLRIIIQSALFHKYARRFIGLIINISASLY